MMQLFSCPCTQQFTVAPSPVAAHVQCPRCRQLLLIPATASVPAPVAQLVPPAPSTPRRGLPLLLVVAFLIGASAGVGIFLRAPLTQSSPSPEQTSRAEQPGPLPHKQTTAPPPRPEPPSGTTTRPSPPPEQPRPPSRPEPRPEGNPETILTQLNAFRRQVGLEEVRLDLPLMQRCRSLPDPSLAPLGLGVSAAPAQALQPLLADPAARLLLLDPAVGRAGIDFRLGQGGEWKSYFLLERSSSPKASGPRVVLCPAEGQTQVPPSFPGNEIPDPIPDARNKVAGFPITVTFPETTRLRRAAGVLKDETGQEVPAWFSSPEKPANPAYRRHQGTTLCLIAREPLRQGSRYRVEMSVEADGQQWSRNWEFTVLSRAREYEGVTSRVLDRINAVRRSAGLIPLLLDDELTQACQSHAEYIARNAPRHPNLNLNDEDEGLPGATPEGKRIARAAHVSTAPFDPGHLVEGWSASFHYRFPLIDRTARKVGIGCAHGPRDWHAVLVLADPGPAPTSVLLYPGEGQRGVPCEYESGERPDPIPESKDRRAGFPVMAVFPAGARVRGVTASLKRGDDEVPIWLSTPEQPVARGMQHNSVCLIARRPLQPDTEYLARVMAQVDGRPWDQSWAFRTRGEVSGDSEAVEALAAVNRHRRAAGLAPVVLDVELSRGCQLHARYLLLNLGHPSTRGLGMHDEDPKLPGFTPEGQRAGNNGVIAGGMPPVVAVEDWMATFYHRIPLLDPELSRIGFGFVPAGPMGWFTVLDASTGKGRETLLSYPAQAQKGVPLRGNGNFGYPVTLWLAGEGSLSPLATQLTDAEGKPIACRQEMRGASVTLIPRAPLRPDATYTAQFRVEVNRRPHSQTWTFTTGSK